MLLIFNFVSVCYLYIIVINLRISFCFFLNFLEKLIKDYLEFLL